MIVLQAWWHWIAANAFHLLVVVYFATSGCLFLLTFAVFALGRRQARLARACDSHQRLLDKLLENFAAQEKTSEGQPVPASAPEPPKTAECLPGPAISGAAVMRHEIEAILAELAPDNAD
ncbi:MAG TPA: hypothetical protein VMF67_11735 [Rhizomicrobium sp.]|nr:hypothetical protein [Rhizomicrobium sp.]